MQSECQLDGKPKIGKRLHNQKVASFTMSYEPLRALRAYDGSASSAGSKHGSDCATELSMPLPVFKTWWTMPLPVATTRGVLSPPYAQRRF